MPNDIPVTVSGNPPSGTYSSSSNKVNSNGNIEVTPGMKTIQFSKAAAATWSFQSPWITLSPSGGPFQVGTCDASQVTITDDDPGGGQDRTYEYTLYTTAGNFDPSIINKGG
jgi:hypothetical protein